MGKLNSYAIVFGSSLAWSLVAVIGGSFVEPGGLFTTLTIGLLAVAALVLPLGLKKIPDLLNEDLYQAGLVPGLLTGALGLGLQSSALQYISPLLGLGGSL